MTVAAIRFTALDRDCVQCRGTGEVCSCNCTGVCSHDDTACGHCGGEGTALAYCGVCDSTIGERGLTGYAVRATRDDGAVVDCIVCVGAECCAEVVRDQREWAGDVPVVGLPCAAERSAA